MAISCHTHRALKQQFSQISLALYVYTCTFQACRYCNMDFRVIYTLVFVTCCALAEYPFQDPSIPWDQRVDDLVGILTHVY